MMFAMLPFLCIFDINDGHCMFRVKKPADERVFSYLSHQTFTTFDMFFFLIGRICDG